MLMKKINTNIFPLLLVCFTLLNSCNNRNNTNSEISIDESSDKNWISIFNGKNLDDWTIKITGYNVNDNFKNTFIVEDGLLKSNYNEYEKFNGEFGHIFYKQKLSYYKVRIEYRFVGEQVVGGPSWGLLNSGIMIHSQSPESMEKNQQFPVCVECQFLGSYGEVSRPTGDFCTPGTHVVINDELIKDHCLKRSNISVDKSKWVTMEVHVYGGDSIVNIVNGEISVKVDKPQLDEEDTLAKQFIIDNNKSLGEGYIALQAESHSIEFRKVELLIMEKE